jgi:DNA-binding CsgD family transcriptional regulator
MPAPRGAPLSAIREAQLGALTQGLEAVALPVVLVDLHLEIVAANSAFQDAYTREAAEALVGDACSRLGLVRSDGEGNVGLVSPWAGEGTISGSRRVRLRPIVLDGEDEPTWVALAVERRAARRLTAENVQHRFGLSPRQAEVALLLAQGQTTAEIARTLNLTTHTVRHHAEQVLRRLNVRSRQQALVRLRDGTARGPRARPSGGHARPF